MSADVIEQYTWRPAVRRGTTGAAISGVDVHVWDDDGDKQVNGLSTDGNGQIAEQTLERRTIQITDTTTRTDVTETPHVARFVKFGEIAIEFQQNILAASEPTFYTNTNSNLTETSKTTINGWSDIAFTHGSDLITVSGNRNVGNVYDKCQVEAEDGVQFDTGYANNLLEIMSTVDATNFAIYYDLTISGATTVFSGQNKTIAAQSSKELTLAGGAVAQNLSWTGDVNINSVIDVSNFNVSGDVDLSVGGAGEYDVTNSNWGSVTSSVPGVIINLLGSSTQPTNNSPTNITINVSVPLKVTVIDKETGLPLPDARVRLLKNSDKSVLLSGDCDVNGEISGSYSGSTPADAVGWAREMNISTPDYHQEDFAGVINAGTGLDLVVALRPITE